MPLVMQIVVTCSVDPERFFGLSRVFDRMDSHRGRGRFFAMPNRCGPPRHSLGPFLPPPVNLPGSPRTSLNRSFNGGTRLETRPARRTIIRLCGRPVVRHFSRLARQRAYCAGQPGSPVSRYRGDTRTQCNCIAFARNGHITQIRSRTVRHRRQSFYERFA